MVTILLLDRLPNQVQRVEFTFGMNQNLMNIPLGGLKHMSDAHFRIDK